LAEGRELPGLPCAQKAVAVAVAVHVAVHVADHVADHVNVHVNVNVLVRERSRNRVRPGYFGSPQQRNPISGDFEIEPPARRALHRTLSSELAYDPPFTSLSFVHSAALPAMSAIA
jgi:hypothetical protein